MFGTAFWLSNTWHRHTPDILRYFMNLYKNITYALPFSTIAQPTIHTHTHTQINPTHKSEGQRPKDMICAEILKSLRVTSKIWDEYVLYFKVCTTRDPLSFVLSSCWPIVLGFVDFSRINISWKTLFSKLPAALFRASVHYVWPIPVVGASKLVRAKNKDSIRGPVILKIGTRRWKISLNRWTEISVSDGTPRKIW